MDLLFQFNKEKKTRKTTDNFLCDLSLYDEGTLINLLASYDLKYTRYGTPHHVIYRYGLTINKKTGDVNTIYKFELAQNTFGNHYVKTVNKKNDFEELYTLTETGLINGQKYRGYWGVKYENAIETIFDHIYSILSAEMTNTYFLSKPYKYKSHYNEFFDFIVDHHLDKKNIKAHDSVYDHIREVYPKQKWLKLNENKFLPAVLDSMGIKSNFLIGEINKNPDTVIKLSSLKYICDLFGDNFIEHIKTTSWIDHCYTSPPNKKTYTLKNDSEKKYMAMLINGWEKNMAVPHSFVTKTSKLLSIREKLEKKGIDVKFKAKDDESFMNTEHEWNNLLEFIRKGYRLKYSFEDDFLFDIESEIDIDGQIFKPNILKTQEDFIKEGHIMKNCMGKLFNGGLSNLFVSLISKNKRVNLQYRNGTLINSYGKANSLVPFEFNDAILVVNNRIKKYKDMKWSREKYDNQE
jgi:hypothetical protein